MIAEVINENIFIDTVLGATYIVSYTGFTGIAWGKREGIGEYCFE